MNIVLYFLLSAMSMLFNRRKKLNRYLYHESGTFNFTVGFTTENGKVSGAIAFKDGHAVPMKEIPEKCDSILIFSDTKALGEMLNSAPNEVLLLLLKGRMRTEGNMAYLNLFNFYISLIMGKKHKKMMEKKKREKEQERIKKKNSHDAGGREIRQRTSMKAPQKERGIKHLEDPFFSQYATGDFPRLTQMLDRHFSLRPEICPERALLLTEWYRKHGFETTSGGSPHVPAMRNAGAFKHLMEKRKPVIQKGALLAGSTTAKEIGVVLYPDAHGTLIWGELNSAGDRELNPYTVTEETIDILHNKVFPFWTARNFREWVRDKYDAPYCQALDERFAVYFLWKTVSLSHTIADFPKLLALGTGGIKREIKDELKKTPAGKKDKRNTLKAMILSLEGIEAYAKNLSVKAREDASRENDPERKKELLDMAKVCARVPMKPARTLYEALQAVWTGWVGLHMENTNAGLSLGRMDQWLQPYFAADMKKIKSPAAREAYIKKAVELVGDFYMRCTDHLPLIPDIGNYLFGGSSSDQAITLGGMTPSGKDAVNDMTYIFLKATEILAVRDPNVNARFSPGVNSDTYLSRLCEVNLITTATPSLHNDNAVLKSLEEFNYTKSHARDWSAVGCVEPTLSGKHMGHTNCMMMNMVAALEMAMNGGHHPLMNIKAGPDTGAVEKFGSFEEFFDAFTKQFAFLIEKSVEYNNLLGEAHAALRPTPFLSSLIDGTVKSGRDVTEGGARYNSSGAACIGLADVTDSLMAVKKLVFEESAVSLKEIKDAVQANFKKKGALHAMMKNRVPLFGSGQEESAALANRIAAFAHDTYGSHKNFRGGPYTAGFWSMSNHVAFGTLTGALPSGRLAGKAFTPGCTPQAHASKSLLDNIRDVASLKAENLNNNIAFNVRVVPGGDDSHEDVVERMYSYVKSYFGMGGMQMQFNVVDTDTLRDAMARPELYRDLLVRISGYNAYFVTLNRDMQIELIERAEYGI